MNGLFSVQWTVRRGGGVSSSDIIPVPMTQTQWRWRRNDILTFLTEKRAQTEKLDNESQRPFDHRRSRMLLVEPVLPSSIAQIKHGNVLENLEICQVFVLGTPAAHRLVMMSDISDDITETQRGGCLLPWRRTTTSFRRMWRCFKALTNFRSRDSEPWS